MSVGRRVFLGMLLAVAGGGRAGLARQDGLDAFALPDDTCAPEDPTPALTPAPTYRPGAPVRTTLATADERGVRLELSGSVAGISCGPIPHAEVEFWQADAGGSYDLAGYRLRGRQQTGPRGEYRLRTILPGAAPGHAPCLNVHVVVPGRAELWTAIFFAGRPENARDPRVRPALVVTLSPSNGGQTGTFDIRLPI